METFINVGYLPRQCGKTRLFNAGIEKYGIGFLTGFKINKVEILDLNVFSNKYLINIFNQVIYKQKYYKI